MHIPEKYKNARLSNADKIDPKIIEMGNDFIEKHHGAEHPFKFIKAKILDDEILKQTREWGSATYYLQTIKETGVLFIDDFGIDRGTERTERDYYDIIDGRWEEERPTIITTNLSPAQIENMYGQRIFSRLKDFKWIKFNGEDLRGGKNENI